MRHIKIAIFDFLLWCGCISVIQAVWETIEISLYGMTIPSVEDTFIGILFSFLLWMVVRGWIAKEVADNG